MLDHGAAGNAAPNRTLREAQEAGLKAARAKRNYRLYLALLELVVGCVGFWLIAQVAGWKLAAGFFLVGWAANIRTKRIST